MTTNTAATRRQERYAVSTLQLWTRCGTVPGAQEPWAGDRWRWLCWRRLLQRPGGKSVTPCQHCNSGRGAVLYQEHRSRGRRPLPWDLRRWSPPNWADPALNCTEPTWTASRGLSQPKPPCLTSSPAFPPPSTVNLEKILFSLSGSVAAFVSRRETVMSR